MTYQCSTTSRRPRELRRVYRAVAFLAPQFDHLKEYQRAYNQKHGVSLDNNQILDLMLIEHRALIGLPTA